MEHVTLPISEDSEIVCLRNRLTSMCEKIKPNIDFRLTIGGVVLSLDNVDRLERIIGKRLDIDTISQDASTTLVLGYDEHYRRFYLISMLIPVAGQGAPYSLRKIDSGPERGQYEFTPSDNNRGSKHRSMLDSLAGDDILESFEINPVPPTITGAPYRQWLARLLDKANQSWEVSESMPVIEGVLSEDIDFQLSLLRKRKIMGEQAVVISTLEYNITQHTESGPMSNTTRYHFISDRVKGPDSYIATSTSPSSTFPEVSNTEHSYEHVYPLDDELVVADFRMLLEHAELALGSVLR